MSNQKIERDKNIDPEVNERHVQPQRPEKVLGNFVLTHLKSKEEW